MRKGTYAEAKRAGFNDTQAAFLSNLGGETREEAVQEVLKRTTAREKVKDNNPDGFLFKSIENGMNWILDNAIPLLTGVLLTLFALEVGAIA